MAWSFYMSNATQIEQLRGDISALEAIVNSGVTQVVEDGRSTSFDLEHCRRQLRELRAKLANLQGKRVPRPLFGSIDISRAE
jgi:hypothetical protein